MSFHIDLIEKKPPPVYQQIAEEAKHLRDLGMTPKAISRTLVVDPRTVNKAIEWEELRLARKWFKEWMDEQGR